MLLFSLQTLVFRLWFLATINCNITPKFQGRVKREPLIRDVLDPLESKFQQLNPEILLKHPVYVCVLEVFAHSDKIRFMFLVLLPCRL